MTATTARSPARILADPRPIAALRRCGVPRHRAGLPGPMVDVMVRATEATRLQQLDVMASRHATQSERSIHLVPGVAGDVLPRLADRLDIGLIVMGTVDRTGLRGLIMGNTAETILRSVRCSVLAVKPRGFVTLVKPQRRSRSTSKEMS